MVNGIGLLVLSNKDTDRPLWHSPIELFLRLTLRKIQIDWKAVVKH